MNIDSFLKPGTMLRCGDLEDGPEFGVVVRCWMSDEIKAYDCYVAFFGEKFPARKPEQRPYVLRYAASSLTVVRE